MGVGILGMGSCLPPTIRGNDFWPSSFAPGDDERRRRDFLVVDRSADGKANQVPQEITEAMARYAGDPFVGARLRHVLDADADPSDMEAEAARRAMREAGAGPGDIDLVIVYSLTPDRFSPTNGPALQAKLELHDAAAWSLDASNASYQVQVVTAAALIRAGLYKRILIVSSQAASRVVDYTTPGSPAFGDAAAAVVLGEVPAGYGILGHWTRTDGALRDGVVIAPVVDGAPQRNWLGANAGPFRYSTYDAGIGKSAGLRSPSFCREACLGALSAAGLTMNDVTLYAGYQTVGWLVDACRRGLGLAPEQVIDTFPEVANIGVATVPFNLERAHRTGRLPDGAIVLTYSQGAGLTRSSVVYRWLAPGTKKG
ncbi:MAG: 3-oxoacyl-[acyl-carrier-protein] synthase III C-terminal domain-containing protein [Minicystis sp.]